MSIPKRDATTILNSLSAGLVPNIGLRHIAVGRVNEIKSLLNDLDTIQSGGGAVRFVTGRYGSGKSFLLRLIRTYALENNFVVMMADFSPERRLYGTDREGLALYQELTKNIATKLRPEGGALPAIIEKWISGVMSKVAQSIPNGDPRFSSTVEKEIMATIARMREMVRGFDFGLVLQAYYRGYMEGDDNLKANAVRWLRGEFNSRSDARTALGVTSVIDSDTYYDYLKIFARFVTDLGYAGLLICLDEAAYLYKIVNSISRKNNYEVILTIVNECLQGNATDIGFIFGGTPEFVEDQRRGLLSYEALRSRLSGNKFLGDGMVDFQGPVLKLADLTVEERAALLVKIREVFQSLNPDARVLSEQEIGEFLRFVLTRDGGEERTSPRELIRDFINLHNAMKQNPRLKWGDIVKKIRQENPTPIPTTSELDLDPRFVDIKLD